MSGIFGALNVSDTERAFVNQIGQELVFEKVNELLARYNAEVALQLSCFVEETTEVYQKRYLLAGGGKLQQMGTMAPAAGVKRYGYYDVAFPIRQWGAQLAGNRVSMAYMTLQELDKHLDTIMVQDLNTLRYRILVALFEDTNLSWTDPIHGALTIKRLANTDGTLYPPLAGTESEAEDDHYWETVTSYAVTDCSDTQNPAVDLRDEIVEHFGGRGSNERNFVVFHNEDMTPEFAALTGYTEIPDQFIRPGEDTAVPEGWPPVPGRIHGRLTGAWLSEWAWIPATYAMGLLLEVPPPLIMRVDPADTGLTPGLQLVATDKQHPMTGAHYEHRFGLGVGNRLCAAIMEISGGNGDYAPPAAYAE